MENITTKYVWCWHIVEMASFVFSQSYCNLYLQWRCWIVLASAVGPFGGKMQSDHLLFAVDSLMLRSWLIKSGNGWSLNRFSTSSPGLIGRCVKTFAWGSPRPSRIIERHQKAHHFDYLFHVKFKRSFRAPRLQRMSRMPCHATFY